MASNADVTSIASKWKEQLTSLLMPEFDTDSVSVSLGGGRYGETSMVMQNGASYLAKKIHISIFSKDEFRNEFVHDCLLLSQLRHPHVAQFLGVHIVDSFTSPILISEMYPLSLGTCLQKYPEMPTHSKYTVLLETAVGVDYLHGLSPPVVHGSLSPGNILLTEGLHVKIADCARFGLNISPASNSPYQAPEEGQAEPGDLFSLGDIMLHIALQREPSPLEYKHHRNIENENEPVILTEIKRRESFLSEVEDTHLLKELILSCLDEEPSKRPPVRSVIQELNEIVKGQDPQYSNVLEMFMALGQLSLMKDSVLSHEETVKAKEEEIEALKEQMEPLNADIAAKDDVVMAVKEEMEGYKQALQSKEGRIKAHETGVRAKEALIKAKDREIAAKKQVLATKEALLRSANKRIAVLEQHVKSSRKKGGNPVPVVFPTEPRSQPPLSQPLSQPLSPVNSTSPSHGSPRPPVTHPYRGTKASALPNDGSRMPRHSSKQQSEDPDLAKILARRQKKINSNMDCIHEKQPGDSDAKPILRKRSKTVDVPASAELKNILQRRKSYIEEDN